MSCKAGLVDGGLGGEDDADLCVVGLAVVTRFIAMLFACRGRFVRGRISRIPRSGGSIRSQRACARTATIGTSRTISSGRSCVAGSWYMRWLTRVLGMARRCSLWPMARFRRSTSGTITTYVVSVFVSGGGC